MPNIEPLISIIVPVYNSEKYLSRCIESILAQSFKNLEIILIDDGSKDASSSICDSYAASDSRIKVIHQENGGIAKAQNPVWISLTGTISLSRIMTIYSTGITSNTYCMLYKSLVQI